MERTEQQEKVDIIWQQLCYWEMIANTLIHREFTSSYTAKFVIEKDRMYTENANRSSGDGIITPDNMEPNPKNPIIASFLGLILGIHGLSDHAFFSFSVLGWLVIGFLGLVLLVRRSNQLETPIINLAILKNHLLTGHVLAFFTFQLGSLAMSFLLPNYVQLVNHSSTTLAALMAASRSHHWGWFCSFLWSHSR